MDRFGIHLEPLNAMLYQVGAFVPRLAIALVVVLAGWLIAKTVRFAVTKALRAINFNVLTERAGLDNFLRQGGWGGDTSSLFGVLAYWLVILAALLMAFNGMGLSYIADLLGRVVWFVPNLFVALLVLAFGSYFARFVGEAVSSYFRGAQMRDAVLLGQIARYAVMAFVILIALDQIKVGGDIVRESFLVVLAGVVFALALAFGLAGKDWAAAQIERWWPRAPKDRSATTTGTTTTTPTIVVEPGKGSSPGERPPR